MDLLTALLLASSGPDPNGANNPSTAPATALMTSNSAPSGLVTSTSNSYEATAGAWRWFDRSIGSRYMFTAGDLPFSVTYQFPTAVQINKAGLTPSTDYTKRSPGSFYIEASNNGTSWVTVMSVGGLTAGNYNIGYYTWFTWSNSNSFIYYRMVVTSGTPTHDGYVGLNEFILVVAV